MNDSPAVILFDIDGHEVNTTQIMPSIMNSTNIPLLATQSFIGPGESITSYQSIDISMYGAPSNADGTLYIEFSIDNIDWDTKVQLNLLTPSIVPIPLRSIAPYFRIRYINGSVDLTTLRLNVVYHRYPSEDLTRFLSQSIDSNEPIKVTRSIINAQYPDSSYNYLQSNSMGMLKTDSSGYLIKTLYDMSSTTVNYIGTALSGTATSSAAWTIKQITFDDSGNPLETTWTNNVAIWDNRLSETYS
ncbi:MAG TPA: hypothetical protein VII94_05900 [Candidatus Saccharimonadales bacterium]